MITAHQFPMGKVKEMISSYNEVAGDLVSIPYGKSKVDDDDDYYDYI